MNNICISVSTNWFKYLNIQLYSIISNQIGDGIKFHILTDATTFEDEFETQKLIDETNHIYRLNNQVEFYNVGKLFNEYINSDINITERFTKYALYRLFVPIILDCDKVLYLDSDTIVNRNINTIFECDLTNLYWIACVDTGIMPTHKYSIGMSENTNYYNSGVAYFNLDKIKKDNLFDKWIHMCNNIQLLGIDQDILNITLSEKSIELNPIYNCSLSTKLDISIDDIIIMHYAGNKPWQTKNVPNYDIWSKYEEKYGSLFRSINNG